MVHAIKDRVRLVPQFSNLIAPLLLEPDYTLQEARDFESEFQKSDLMDLLAGVSSKLKELEVGDWSSEKIKACLGAIAADRGIKYVQVMKPMRYALAASKVHELT
jgi:hypothetical protein